MRKMVNFSCDYCGGPGSSRADEFAKKKHHFCRRQCYTDYRREVMPPEEQNAWKGGISPAEAHRRWKEKNKAKVKAMAEARRLRELNAPGHHTKKQWLEVKEQQYHNTCAENDDTCKGKLTKDHVVPLIMGGSQDPDNLQPLCWSHNSRKARKVHLGTFAPQ
jgi:5-methylcytosine-specific restriction endonuclease McrA